MRSATIINHRFVRTWLFLFLVASITWLGGATYFATAGLSLAVSLSALFFLPRIYAAQSLLSLSCAALSTFTLLQACPLPLQVVAHLSPETLHYHLTTAQAFGLPAPDWRAISLSPSETSIEAAKWASFSLLASLGYFLGKREGLRHFSIFLALTSSALAVCFWAHQLVGAEQLFGIYRFHGGTPLTPLLNVNNLAGCLNLGTLAWLGIAYSNRTMIAQPIALTMAIFGAATTLQTGSRAGAFSLALGGILLAGISASGWLKTESRQGSVKLNSLTRSRLLPIGLTAILSLFLAFALNSHLKRALFDADIEKIYDSIELAKATLNFPWLGTGRGASATISSYYVEKNLLFFKYIESFPLSWCLEWGLFAGLYACVSFILVLLPQRLQLRRSWLAISLWVGLCVLLLQNLFDIALELYAPTALLITSIGYLLGRRAASTGATRFEQRIQNQKLIPILMLMIGSTMGLTGLLEKPDLRGLRASLFQRVKDLKNPNDSTHSAPLLLKDIAQAARTYPAERRFLVLAALTQHQISGAKKDADFHYLSELLRRSPDFAQAHLLTGHLLASQGATEQALLEFKKAYVSQPATAYVIARYALKLTQSYELLQQTIPNHLDGANLAAALAKSAPASNGPLKLRLLKKAHELNPQNAPYRINYALLNAQQFIQLGKECKASSCLPETLKRLEALTQANTSLLELTGTSQSCGNMMFRARLSAAKQDYDEALQLTRGKCNTCSSIVECLKDRLKYADQSQRPNERKQAEKEYLSFMCENSHTCAIAESLLAARAGKRKAWLTASVHAIRAATIADSGNIWAKSAYFSAKANRLPQAIVAVRNAKRLGANVSAAEEAIKIAREKGKH